MSTTPQPAPDGTPEVTPAASRARWRQVRDHLNRHRFELTRAAAAEQAARQFAPGGRLLAREHWIPEAPVPLERVRLRWQERTPAAPVDGRGPELDATRARRDDGTPYPCYADAVRDLARPKLFEDRSCYRLLAVAPDAVAPTLTFGRGTYFDVINVCEAAAHEYAAAALAAPGRPVPAGGATPLRAALGDPTDLDRRPVMTAVSTLVIRHDRRTGAAEFVLHRRDPAKVATGGGLFQVMPVGMFQASHDAPWNEANDFDLWRAVVRELSEELLGGSEDYGSGAAPIDYDGWPFNRTLTEARAAGTLRVSWLGLGMDPLTFVTDLLTVAVFDAELFDTVFARIVSTNDEGHRVRLDDGTGHAVGIPFTAEQVERLTTGEPMQPAGAELLHLAWLHRETLLNGPA
ncbi:XRE family transcriptional regulator [Kitasatospora sp. NPDC086009]|uniref:XRE family transcriptional regulator n=1 Tax=unclassified Kitasatospora TaxID=2633591 RepID=UPI0037C7D9CD